LQLQQNGVFPLHISLNCTSLFKGIQENWRNYEIIHKGTLDEYSYSNGFCEYHTKVAEVILESGIKEGLCLVNAMHITASVFINDDEPGLHRDYKQWLEELAPHAPINRYDHNRTGEDNGDAHHKRQIMGREVMVAITDGSIHFGPWEQIFYGEFDGKRRKRVLVKVIGE